VNKNLFIGGFPYETTPEQLGDLFKTCGGVVGVKIMRDRETGRSRGLAFVEMADEAGAQAAIERLDGTTIGGRKMFVGEARPQKTKPGFGERPAFAPAAAPALPPGGVERRSGRDRRQGWGPLGGDRRSDRPAAPAGRERSFPPKRFGPKKPWGDKPGFGDKKPWEKKPWEKRPASAEGGEGGLERKRFGPKKPWSGKPGFGDKKPWEKKPWEKRPASAAGEGFKKKWTPGGPKKSWSPGGPKKSWSPGGPKKSWAPGGPKKSWAPGGPKKKWAGKPRKSGGKPFTPGA
jgi:hypothetical protein